ncbi:arsenic transporter [Salmonella enterica]|uniref:Arsenic transporter n=1 Tax=Salmonella enterica TaxID=28901 RepID=A0A5Y3BVN6_SALER|nr:arsenic transporter [Salmonella enterica subsp. enterica]EAM2421452.1 arsenic transporter [Salmonella enterica]EDP9191746.1 arsenic transporter [Salmonella enterica subsp. enterica serovar 4,[5],12:b:-]EDW5149046.1 arsenic transporter [Salmonella enterica subsp. enterica serovar Java]EAB9840156.1 arsenic transporter [Salmonella enterica subsp. enterica]
MFANADSELILTPIIIAVLLASGFSKSTRWLYCISFSAGRSE